MVLFDGFGDVLRESAVFRAQFLTQGLVEVGVHGQPAQQMTELSQPLREARDLASAYLESLNSTVAVLNEDARLGRRVLEDPPPKRVVLVARHLPFRGAHTRQTILKVPDELRASSS